MRLAVFGAGKLGLPLATVLARRAHVVRVYDPAVTPAIAFSTTEPDVEDYINLVEFCIDGGYAAQHSEMTFIVVPTPSLSDGSFDDQYVREALSMIEKATAGQDHLAVIVSTVSPGTCDALADDFENEHLKIAYNPTFIALGQVVSDLLYPDLLLVGSRFGATEDLWRLWRSIIRPSVITEFDGSFVEAEITKLSINCYLTLKIAFANSIGQLCDAYDVSTELLDIIGSDHRIGKGYLKAGGLPSGPCLPRDGAALQAAALAVDLEMPLMDAAAEVNQSVVDRIVIDILNAHPKVKSVGILGTAYKPGSSINTGSLGSELMRAFTGRDDIKLKVHDPLDKTAPHSIKDVCACAVVVIATPNIEYMHVEIKGRVIDPWGILS